MAVSMAFDDCGLPVVADKATDCGSSCGDQAFHQQLQDSGLMNLPLQKSLPVSSGTTIVGCVFNGGVILGADTRTSAGSYVVNRAARKISPICSNIFICRSGSAADTQAITQIAKAYMSNYIFEHINNSSLYNNTLGASSYKPDVRIAATIVQEVAYTYKKYFTAGMIIGGVNAQGTPQLFSIPIGGSLMEMKYTAGGSGSAFISAFLDKHYREDMSKQEALELVKHAVGYAISRDGSSGGMIRLLCIEQNNVQEHAILGNQLPVDP